MKILAQLARARVAALVLLSLLSSRAQVPENLVVDGLPPIPESIRKSASRYLDFRMAALQSWHPMRREMLITTRFGDAAQLHRVARPGGARQQLTFLREPVSGGQFQPRLGNSIVFVQDMGGGEFFQFYRLDLESGEIVLLTDGKSRNTGLNWANSGKQIAYSSTRRNGRDTDIYVMDPLNPASARLVLEVSGGGMSVSDWSEDDQTLLLTERISINESYLWRLDLGDGRATLITPKGGAKVSFQGAQFGSSKDVIYVASDLDSDFLRLGRLEVIAAADSASPYRWTPLSSELAADVESLDVAPNGRTIAFVANESGVSVLRIADGLGRRRTIRPELPRGVIGGLTWHSNGRDLGFTLSAARSVGDAYSYDVKRSKLERWTHSEAGGLNPERFAEPELARMKSFDGLEISSFVYRPDPARYPGPRPVLMSIHGGPESQSRPIFQARLNYFIEEMGLALVVPNVRGSSGSGKTFLTLDNGFKREDSVRDIGAVLDWIATQPGLDKERVAVIGGSYGGYMVLASMIHHAARLKTGIDIVGISNFLTFLKNTQEYRRDLRRVEYGDERDEAMREFLGRISPANQAQRIVDPLFVIQGLNDPRVPASESEQMVKAVRQNGGKVWYLLAKDEGHGFAKKPNQDFQFLATIRFLKEFLLDEPATP